MKTYYITVTEKLQRTFRVTVEDVEGYEGAEEKLIDAFNNDEIVLDGRDFFDRDFKDQTKHVMELVNEGFFSPTEFQEVK